MKAKTIIVAIKGKIVYATEDIKKFIKHSGGKNVKYCGYS